MFPSIPIPPAVVIVILALVASATAQVSTRPSPIPAENPPRLHALVGATVVPEPGVRWERATIVIRDGRIAAAGPEVAVPAGARVWDLAGRVVHAGYVDAHAPIPAALRAPEPAGPRPEVDRLRAGLSVASSLDAIPEATLEARRKLGFTAALITPDKGILRGTAALVSLRTGRPDEVLLGEGPLAIGFEYTAGSRAGYPTSLMGTVAALRQAALDATWLHEATLAHASADPASRPERPAPDLHLEALGRHLPAVAGPAARPVSFVLRDELDIDIVNRVAPEFGLRGHLVGSGFEYRRIQAMRRAGMPVVLPLDFPAAPAVGTPSAALAVSLDQLQHWHHAPTNARELDAAGVPVAFSPSKGAIATFWDRVRRSVEAGLPADKALAALTTVPASIAGRDDLGRIAPGALAHLAIWDGDPFVDKTAKVVMTWVDGLPLPVDKDPQPSIDGSWALEWPAGRPEEAPAALVVRAKGTNGFVLAWGDDRTADLRWANGRWTSTLRAKDGPSLLIEAIPAEREGQRAASLAGTARLADGSWVTWTARRTGDAPETPDSKPARDRDDASPAVIPGQPPAWPAGAHGRRGDPARESVVLLRGATLWTQAEGGVLATGDLLVRDGRIAEVAPSIEAPDGAHVIDLAGRHVTPGIIDAHSHVAIRGGVNEFHPTISAECRIVDVLEPTDIDLYRQLAFGVTTAHLLHGSANAIGGQNAIIKLRWGREADGLLLEGAPPGVKFALGENPKRSNYMLGSGRYPQTRGGVEQVYVDAFRQALAPTPSDGLPPRRNLRAEAVREIVEGTRQIHVHSYRADEILMFIRIAERFGLKVATFQHVLEGYKVAPEIAALGAGASTFADIWTYKVELQDATPYNSAILHRAGVVTSVNSDNAELARRLHLEAAKAVRYGGLSETEALALVTSNPARQLGIDHRVGSLRPGLDADLVIWSGHPLSTASRVEQTWIDGIRWYDAAEAAAQAKADAAEHARLAALALASGGKSSEEPKEERPAPTNPRRASTFFASEDGSPARSPWDRPLYHDGGTPSADL